MLTEIKTKLVSVLRADPTLGSLLASADAIYYRRPPKQAAFPCLILSADERPEATADRAGRHAVELQLDILSTSGDTNDAILAALDNVLFDGHRQGALDTTNFRVAACRRVSSRAVETLLRPMSGHEVERRETVWRLALLKKNA